MRDTCVRHANGNILCSAWQFVCSGHDIDWRKYEENVFRYKFQIRYAMILGVNCNTVISEQCSDLAGEPRVGVAYFTKELADTKD